MEHKNPLGHWNYSVYYCNGWYMSLHIFLKRENDLSKGTMKSRRQLHDIFKVLGKNIAKLEIFLGKILHRTMTK